MNNSLEHLNEPTSKLYFFSLAHLISVDNISVLNFGFHLALTELRKNLTCLLSVREKFHGTQQIDFINLLCKEKGRKRNEKMLQ